MRVRKVTSRHVDAGCSNRFQVAQVVGVEVKVGKDLGTVGPVPKPPQVDVLAVHEPTFGQAPHRGGLAGQQNGTQPILSPVPGAPHGKAYPLNDPFRANRGRLP